MRRVLSVPLLASVWIVAGATADVAAVTTIDLAPACANPGASVAVTGAGWVPLGVPSEYGVFFDDVQLVQQGPPLAAGEQPNASITVPAGTTSGVHVVVVALRRTSDQEVVQHVQMRLAVPCPASAATPRPVLVSPTRKEQRSLTGIVALEAWQREPLLPPAEVRSATFEYSTDRLGWTLIGIAAEPSRDLVLWEAVPRTDDWGTSWDVRALPPGRYFLRMTIETFDGRRGDTVVRVVVRPPAVAAITFAPGATPGSVVFNGRSSTGDWPQGCCRSFAWDFGDGTTGTGPVVEHTYADLDETYAVSLTIETHFATQDAIVAGIGFAGGTVVAAPAAAGQCECQEMTVRTTGQALGADGVRDGRRPPWPKERGIWDGATLGPLSGNPEGRTTSPRWIGYAFEVLVRVRGNRARCRQIQLVRRTGNGIPKTWIGREKDLDLDGRIDIDVSTSAACVSANGTWLAATQRCALEFGSPGTRFGPDEETQGGLSYEHPWKYKKHPDRRIIWADAPGNNGTNYHAEFVSIVRGTDGLYCFAEFAVDAVRGTTEPEPTVTVHNQAPQSDLPALGWPRP